TAEPNGFFVRTSDEQYYSLVKTDQVRHVPAPMRAPVMGLDEVLSDADLKRIKAAKKIVFHAAGDTGPSRSARFHEAVVERMEADFQQPPAAPAFFYHLGDVVYNFGEPEYYYSQFYEPHRNYPAPIFAIP